MKKILYYISMPFILVLGIPFMIFCKDKWNKFGESYGKLMGVQSRHTRNRLYVTIFDKDYTIRDLYAIAHNEQDDDIIFDGEETDYICDNSDVRHYVVYMWKFHSKTTGECVNVYIRHYDDTDTISFYTLEEDPQDSVEYCNYMVACTNEKKRANVLIRIITYPIYVLMYLLSLTCIPGILCYLALYRLDYKLNYKLKLPDYLIK